MLPIVYKFTFDTDGSRALLYLAATALVIYATWSGWRTTVVASDRLAGQGRQPSRQDRLRRAALFGLIGAGLSGLGLYYALPELPWLGVQGRGEGVPIHTYGILVGGGFIAAVTVAGWLAAREWPGIEGVKKRNQIFDLAFYVFIGAIVGSRELFVLVNLKELYWYDPTKVVEAKAVIIDLVVLGGLLVLVPLRNRLFSRPVAEKLLHNAFAIYMWAFVGGRVLLSLGSGAGFLNLADMLGGGLVFYGGLIGAALVSFWYTRKVGIDFWRLADIAMPTVSLGQALGRLGCFSAGCCWGRITTASTRLAVTFPGRDTAMNLFGGKGGVASLAWSTQSDPAEEKRWVIEATGQLFDQAVPGAVKISDWALQHGHTLPVHPTQLYESFGQMALFAALLTMRGVRRFHGQIFGTWLICYAVLRSTVELFRGDVARGTLFHFLNWLGLEGLAAKVPLDAWYNISVSQFISLCMFALGVTVLGKRFRGSSDRVVDLSGGTQAAKTLPSAANTT